jgi:site-specific DNA-methyltransferase (adenine-specific)
MTIEKYMNKIICGDCLEVMRDWPDGCVDLTVTSPPYDDLRDYKGYTFDFEGIAKQLYRITKQGGVVVWVVGDMTVNGSETGTSFRQALYFKEIGFNLHDTMIYAKGGFANPSSTRYHQVFEYMFIFSKGMLKTFNPIIDRINIEKRTGGTGKRQTNGTMKYSGGVGGKPLNNYGQRYNVWRYKIGGGNVSTDRIAHEHPAIFPEQLAIDHVKSWSNQNHIIIDPMCGSGTTCVAAKKLGRRFIGIDISKDYCQIARERLKAVDTGVPVKEARNGQQALFETLVNSQPVP